MEQKQIDLNKIVISLSILLAGVMIAGAILYTKSVENDSPIAEDLPSVVDIKMGSNQVLGDKNAPVQIIEFSDFQCPFCRSFWEGAYSEIKSKYIDTGKVALEFRDYPLDFHPAAVISARAARCAGDQNMFWQMHDKIFSEQAEQGTGTIYYEASDIKNWAKEIGLNTQTFNTCLDSDKYADDVQDDFKAGQKYGVSGTPTFFINGTRVVGAQPFSVFESIIEAELK